MFTGWPHQSTLFADTAKRLGVVYCFNRPCSLFAVPAGASAGPGCIQLTGGLL